METADEGVFATTRTSSSKTAQSGVERVADGGVSVGGQQKNRPDGGRLGAGRRRPGVRLQPRHVGHEHLRHPVGGVDERLCRLDEEAGDQVGGVDAGERL